MFLNQFYMLCYIIGQHMMFWCLSHRRAVPAQANPRMCFNLQNHRCSHTQTVDNVDKNGDKDSDLH